LATTKILLNFKVDEQGHGTGFSITLPLRDRTMLLIAAARPIAIGRRWRHCYKYHSCHSNYCGQI